MSTSALIMMIVWTGFVTIMTGYFFYKVLTAKPKDDEENARSDDEKKSI